MAFPQRCSCGCFLAPQLRRCPKCNKKVKRAPVSTDDEKDRAETARLAHLNHKAKTLNARKLKWVIPTAGQRAERQTWKTLRRQLKSGVKFVRSELRLSKSIALEPRAGRWSWEHPPPRLDAKGDIVITRGLRPTILVSPKGNRYVKAHPNEYADLILDYGPRDKAGWFFAGGPLQYRLRKYAHSSIAKQSKKQAHEDQRRARAQHERKKAKRQRKQKVVKRTLESA